MSSYPDYSDELFFLAIAILIGSCWIATSLEEKKEKARPAQEVTQPAEQKVNAEEAK